MKEILLNAFQMNTTVHAWPGMWRHPRDRSHAYKSLDYWIDIARIAERGKLDGLFLADPSGVIDIYGGSPAAALAAGAQVPNADPAMLIGAMAAATRHLGFGLTASLSYETPYYLARRFSTLDHLTNGRIGWNIVTGHLDSGAKALGTKGMQAHDDRYDRADEFLEIVYKLWEASWDDNAVVRDAEAALYTDPARVRAIHHHGKYFDIDAIHTSEPSPQRTPVLYQAGASSRGRAFAARHAECVFANQSFGILKETIADIRRRAVENGRRAEDVRVFVAATVIVGKTEAEARDRHEEYRRYFDARGALTLFSSWTGIDLSKYGLDNPIPYIKHDGMQSRLEALTIRDPGRIWRVRDLVDFGDLPASGPFIVGNPVQVVDEMVRWVEEADVDGFNLHRVVEPENLEHFVDLAVPELQNRGLFKTEYRPGSLREKLTGEGARLPARHVANQFRPWSLTASGG